MIVIRCNYDDSIVTVKIRYTRPTKIYCNSSLRSIVVYSNFKPVYINNLLIKNKFKYTIFHDKIKTLKHGYFTVSVGNKTSFSKLIYKFGKLKITE